LIVAARPGRSKTSDNTPAFAICAGRPLQFTFADGTRIVAVGPFDTDNAQYLIEAALGGVGIARFIRLAIQNGLAKGHLRIVLPEAPLVSETLHVLHPFGRQVLPRVRLFIDFLVDTIGGLSGTE
jgi:DNA-binding transcriptional LysR family regulator